MMDFEQPDIAQALGVALKTAREQAHLTVAEAANHLHLKQSFVHALEQGDYAVIGSMVYVKGYLRIYTRWLNINLDDGITQLKLDVAPPIKAKTQYSSVLSGRDKVAKLNGRRIKQTFLQKKVLLLLIGLVILICAFWFVKQAVPPIAPSTVAPTAPVIQQVLTLPPVASQATKLGPMPLKVKKAPALDATND